MPIYEYECPKCGIVEVSQGIMDSPLNKCPKCRRKVKRLISLNNFHLKGSGWYQTDYARKSKGADGANGKAQDKKSESKTETTPKTEPVSKATESKDSKKSETTSTSTGTNA